MPSASPSLKAGRSGRACGAFLRLAALGLAGVLPWVGCAPTTGIGKAAFEQDVARDISWELRKDARLGDVNPCCDGGTVRLKGRVESKAAEADAVRIAQASSHGTPVISELEIRPR